ncbi:glycosyltransferase family 2 protein [Mucilaginibacter sabulilitoris]|uniref:Glycosyltransferase family 2 protein n=1 Tax=Mucilaginibacter sabulilitoris TaxID=1173583 RepID=A0ABZ0TF98_9SPHI|nr:glycosyltransferase family 2 protein [Mucilaginibacter sabulilitoris]WPU91647.1 glycosyltransferase family 2 protein [Mucilaginibacter sabulilitoris]
MTYSLLVPCYNAEKYVVSFLSNLSKLHKPFDEVIFYDDASTDATMQLLLAGGHQVIKGDINKGPGYARNRLAHAATGDYIHFHDIDDEFNLGFLLFAAEKAAEPGSDVIVGQADWIDAVTREVMISWRYNHVEISNDPLSYFLAHPLGVINTLCKRSVFLQINGFNEDIRCWEDADLHIRLAAAGAGFAVIDEILAYSLRHHHGISRDQTWCWNCRLKFLEGYFKLYSKRVDRGILKEELKKIQQVLVITAQYRRLSKIIRLNQVYQLGIPTRNISILYYLNKIIPALVLSRLLRLYTGSNS